MLCIEKAINYQHWTSSLDKGFYSKIYIYFFFVVIFIFFAFSLRKNDLTCIYIKIMHQVRNPLLFASFRCTVCLYLSILTTKNIFFWKKYTFSFFGLKSLCIQNWSVCSIKTSLKNIFYSWLIYPPRHSNSRHTGS